MATETPTAPVAAPAKPAAAVATPEPSKAAATPAAASTPAKRILSDEEFFGKASGENEFDVYDAKLKAKREQTAKKETDPEPKPGEKAKEPAAAPNKDERRIEGPPALREELKKRTSEIDALRQEKTGLEAKVKEFESRGKDATALTEQIAAIQKERDELQAQMRALKQEASPEFKEKYDKPFTQAAEYAKTIMQQLTVLEPDPANPDAPRTRQGTWEDFVSLYHMPLNKALTAAKKMFGDSSSVVEHHLTRLQDLDYQRDVALKEEKAQWSEREKKQQTESAKEREFIRSTWTKVNQDIADKHPEWYQPNPKDPEETAILEEGFKLVDSEPQTMQQKIVRDAHIRLKAASHGRLVFLLNKERARVAELESIVAEKNNSEPGAVQKPGGAQTPDVEVSLMDDLRKTVGQ